MVKRNVEKIVISGVFSALVIVLGMTQLGFIPLPVGAVTILQVPAIITGILAGPAAGCFVGLLFGVFSIVQAALAGTTPVDLAFLHYPYIAILPRVLIGPAAWFIYSIAGKAVFSKQTAGKGNRPPEGAVDAQEKTGAAPAGFSIIRETWAVILAAAGGSLVNTTLVLFALAFLVPEITWPMVLFLLSLNGTLEAGFSALISLGVVLPWKGIPRRGGRSKLNSGV
ncbi:MAG: ECF transporter S component [Treponema sp.]|jgi:uncharacterized membrane protein|nr:ECF transporter S component [Treponema sp.]